MVLRLLRRAGACRVLDLGCGNGAFCRTLKDAGFDVVGCDGDARGIALARARSPDIRFETLDLDASPELSNEPPFDAVVSTEVVEHLYRPRRLPEVARFFLKDRGALVVSTPYHGYLKNLALAVSGHWDSHHTALWEGGHIKFWSRATLTQLLQDGGFEVTGFAGAGRMPFLWKSMVLLAEKR